MKTKKIDNPMEGLRLARCFDCGEITLCNHKERPHKEPHPTIRGEEIDVKYVYLCEQCMKED